MSRVPDGKKIYIGGRKFLSGEVLPPFVMLEPVEMLTQTQVAKLAEAHEKTKPKKKRFNR